MSNLEGKVVAITGAARGMGRAFTQAFLAQGAKVAAMDLSWEPSGFSSDRDDAFLKELRSRPDDVLVLDADVTNDAQLDAAYEATIAKWGTCDVLMNDAAMRQRILFPPTGRITTLETSDEDWRRSFEVNVFGALKVTRRFIKPMLAQKKGSVMSIISSGALHHSMGGAYMGLRPNSREMPYQSTKAALLTMMFYLADEIQNENVAVNVLVPAHTRTTGFDEQNIARREMGLANRNAPPPLRPEHIVPLALFLAEQDVSTGVTGKCFDTVTWNIEHGLGKPEAWYDMDGASVSENDALRAAASKK
jgi:NAD(P)-dependent dehydrogenase (short-subunit alcohol dehydrogenase family)